MRAVAVLLKVGPRENGDYITQEALEAALPSMQKLEGVYRAWIEGDELKAEVEVKSEADSLRIFGKAVRP